MQEVTANVLSAIESPHSIHLETKIILQPSLLFIDQLDSEYDPLFADSAGIIDDPIPQEMAISGSGVVTFYNDSGALKYTEEGSATANTIAGITIVGKVGVFGNYLFAIEDDGDLHRYSINWGGISLSSDTFVATPEISDYYAIHAVSETEIVVFAYIEGGFKVYYYDMSSNSYTQDHRFMFPSYVDDDRLNRSISGMIEYSAAAELDGKVYAYISNALTGMVEGISLDKSTGKWSDIFVAVPTDLDVSLCETRIGNAYVKDNTIYLIGQLSFIEGADEGDNTVSFCLLMRSTNGKNFTCDRSSAITNLNYRFLAKCENSLVYISSCNRIGKGIVTYIHSPESDSQYYSYEITNKISEVTFTNRENARFSFADASKLLLNHEWMKPGSRMICYISYLTSSGLEDVIYGNYIIDQVGKSLVKGDLSVSAVNESLFNLSDLNSPYYSEVISKSSIYADLSTQGDFYTSGSGGFVETAFSVDFWKAKGYEIDGVTPIDLNENGGLDKIIASGNHDIGIKTGLLTSELGCESYPEVTSSTVHVKIYGWSHDDRASGSSNDDVEINLIMLDPLGNEVTSGSSGKHFPNTYPETAAGDYPIEYDVECTVGYRIKEVALVFSCANDTEFYAHRVEVTSGVNVYYAYKTNTAWELEDNKLKLPAKKRPFIMFAQKPYDAQNFIISAGFTVSTDTGISGYPIGAGLVGLAIDASNYIVARYNSVSNKFQLVQVISRYETLLAEVTPTDTVDTDFEMQFEHRYGDFTIYMRVSGEWIKQLEYSWLASDGYMTKDRLVSSKVGIYGVISMPSFRITSFEPGEDESGSTSYGIPVLPGPNTYSDFPSSGLAEIGNNVYSYTTKLSEATIRGPSQFRQANTYESPYGNGSPGIECRDFYWRETHGFLTNMLCAFDDGLVYNITDDKWDIWITTSGFVVELPDRARYYSTEVIYESSHTLHNRVYATYGLTGISLVKGDDYYHSWGTECRYYIDGDIYCNWFSGSSGKEDATISDLIDMISRTSGAVACFSGDITDASLDLVSGSGTIGSLEYVSGFDLRFDIPQFSENDYVDVYSDTGINGDAIMSSLRIECSGSGVFDFSLISRPDETVIDTYQYDIGDSAHSLRVLYHDSFATVYVDGQWVITFCRSSIDYQTTCNIDLVSSISDLNVTNIRLVNLSDWSEAFYIDLETDSKSAIASVIKERPVEIIAQPDGSIDYTYHETRYLHSSPGKVTKFQDSANIPSNGASNAIIYADQVRTIRFDDYLKDFGFATKVYRMPNLTIGALKAAKLILQRAYESRFKYDVDLRPDARLVTGDAVNITKTVFPTNNSIDVDIIIERISLQIRDGNYSMSLSGRAKS